MTTTATPTALEPPRSAQEISSMERHDTTMRAARCLIGAGTFAAGLLALAVNSASAQTPFVCYAGGEGDPTVCGHVFTDTNNSGGFDDGEGEPNVVVGFTDADGNNVSNSPTPSGGCADVQSCGYYSYSVFEPGDYWVCLVPDPTKADCTDPVTHPEAKKITVGPSGQVVDFQIGSGGSGVGQEPPVWGVGTGTPGYWKNHPEAWPGPVVVGNVTYSLSTAVHPNLYDAIKLMGKVSGDKTLSMFAALLSAKLNVMLDNNTVCITDTIGKANQWMVAHPVGSNVKASSPAWTEADQWHQLLDDYNNGKLCAPHRD
jgi:hypothetical protein